MMEMIYNMMVAIIANINVIKHANSALMGFAKNASMDTI